MPTQELGASDGVHLPGDGGAPPAPSATASLPPQVPATPSPTLPASASTGDSAHGPGAKDDVSQLGETKRRDYSAANKAMRKERWCQEVVARRRARASPSDHETLGQLPLAQLAVVFREHGHQREQDYTLRVDLKIPSTYNEVEHWICLIADDDVECGWCDVPTEESGEWCPRCPNCGISFTTNSHRATCGWAWLMIRRLQVLREAASQAVIPSC